MSGAAGQPDPQAAQLVERLLLRHSLQPKPFELQPFEQPATAPLPWKCAILRRACMTVLEPQAGCSSTCKNRSFRIDVYGSDAAVQINSTLRRLRRLHDPLDSFRLRHLERDVFVGHGPAPPVTVAQGPHLIWPHDELSYGDFWRDTLVPLGHVLRAGALPGWLGFAGLPPGTNAIDGLRRVRQVCTFERTAPGVPRCSPACYERLPLCEIDYLSPLLAGGAAFLAVAALDEALGFSPHATPALAAVPGVLRVLFAARSRRRFLTNTAELVRACDGLRLDGWTLRCEARSLAAAGGGLGDVVETMRGVDVFVSMHGGDLVNALHMRPGRTVIELVNRGFDRADLNWLDQYARLARPTLHVRRVTIPGELPPPPPPPPAPPLEARAPPPPPLAPWGKRARAERNRAVNLGWAANGTLPVAVLLAELQAVVALHDAPSKGDGEGGIERN